MLITSKLQQESNALILSPGIAKNIWEGKANTIVLDKYYKSYENKLFYLIDQASEGYKAYGVIRLQTPDKITTAEFSDMKESHGLDEDYKESHWPHKEVLFSYKFDSVKLFDNPVNVTVDLTRNTIEWMNQEEVKEKEYTTEELKEMILKSFEAEGYKTENLFSNETYFRRELKSFAQKRMEEMAFSHKPFQPMAVEMSLTKEMMLSKYDKTKKYSIEPLYDGKRVVLMKFGMVARLFSEERTDISKFYPEIIANASKISGKDYVIDGVLKCGVLRTVDCLQYGERDLSENNWFERRSAMGNLHFNNVIAEIPHTFVETNNDFEAALEFSGQLPGAIGLVVKNFDSKYQKDGKSDWVIVFNDENMPENEDNTEIVVEMQEVTHGDYFTKWSPSMAYFIGFLAVDGYVDVDRNQIEITMSGKEGDDSILDQFASEVGGIALAKKGTEGLVRLRWTSPPMVEDLKKIGFGIKKEQREVYKHVPAEYVWQFIRGVFDADGYMAKDKPRIQVDNGMSAQQKWLVDKLKTVGGEDVHLYQYSKHWKVPQYKIIVLGEGAVKVHDKVYNCSGPAIKRKREIKW